MNYRTCAVRNCGWLPLTARHGTFEDGKLILAHDGQRIRRKPAFESGSMGSPDVAKVTRQQLYEQVWSIPVTQVAKLYGLSDVGLAKVLKAHEIPYPARGFWAKKHNGKTVRQMALRPASDARLNTIEFHKQPDRPTTPRLAEAVELAHSEKRDENRIEVPDRLDNPHPLVARTEKSARSARPNTQGRVRPGAQRCLDVEVSPACLDRAMRILDALLKGLDARAYTVRVRDEDVGRPWRTQVNVLDEWIGIRLREKVERRERKPTAEERAEARRYPGLYGDRKYHQDVPTGQLRLEIEATYGTTRRREDGDGKRLEDQLNRFVAGLVRRAEAIKQDRLEAEQRRKAWEEEARRRQQEALRRQEEERRRKEEEARLRALEDEAQRWARARLLRDYLAAVREAARDRNGLTLAGSDLERWFIWAERQATTLDPLAKRV
jgi:hypothetical protein